MIAQRHAALLLQVTIAPREKYPLGQTVLKVNEQRERTHMFTRRYLEEQLYTTLGRSAACSADLNPPPISCGLSQYPICIANAWHEESRFMSSGKLPS